MGKIIAAVLIAIMPLQAAFAEARKPPAKFVAKQKAPKQNPCAEFGAGFVQVEGTSTCVRLGGSIGVGMGVYR